MKERDVNFFRPMWRRVVVTAICAVWAVLELYGRDQTWILITLGLTAYAVWTFFISFPKDRPAVAPAGMADSSTDPGLTPPTQDGENDAPPQA